MEVPQQTVLRISLRRLRILGRLLIGRRGQHQPVHLLDAPATLDEGVGQPIEQFGVRGALAVDAKVGSGGDDAAPKVLLPNAIHYHARGEGIFRRSNPLGQRRAPTAGGELPVAVALDRGRLGVADDG